MIESPIKILQLQPGDSKEDAKKNFRRLSFLYHPDKNPNDKTACHKFHKLVEAYKAVDLNPSLLKGDVSFLSKDIDYSYVDIHVSVEDLYMNKEKNLKIFIPAPCNLCKGTGTKNTIKGICTMCNGSGEIKNTLLKSAIGKTHCICPKCDGTGINKEYTCDKCNGKKTQNEIKKIRIKLNPSYSTSKHLILRQQGEYCKDEITRDLCIRINVIKNYKFKFMENYLTLSVPVTPAEYYGGCTKKVNVFGKIFSIKLPVENDELIANDYRQNFKSVQKILFKIIQKRPILNKETVALYKKIAKIEASLSTE